METNDIIEPQNYYQKNKLKLRQYYKQYYQENRAVILERQNKYNHIIRKKVVTHLEDKTKPTNKPINKPINKPVNIVKKKGKAGAKTALIINNLYKLQQRKEAFIKKLQEEQK